MSAEVIGLIGIVAVLVLMFLGMPVALGLILAGFVGFSCLSGSLEAGLTMAASAPLGFLFSLTFVVIPLFVFMGAILSNSAVGARIFDTAYKWLGQARGGLAYATVFGCALFAACCGSSPATAATMCKVAYPQMEKYKYKPALSAGVVATGGTLGILIPPSISFVIYSILTEESIGKLFIAGIIPGVIQALLLMLVVFVWTRVDPAAGPAAPVKVSLKEKLQSLTGTGEILFLFLLVMGGMFLGWFSANEAAGVGAAGAVLVASLRKMLTVKQFWEATRETLKITAMITLLISGGIVFAGFMSISRLPFALADFVLALNAPPMVIMFAIIIIYFICGALMEMTSVLIVTIPIFYRLIIAMGFDPIWFGVVVVMLIEIALITPPVGLNVWVIGGMLPHVPMGQIFRGAMIILIGSVASLIIVLFFPQIALFLPHLMK